MKRQKNSVVPSILVNLKEVKIELTIACLGAEEVCKQKIGGDSAESKTQIKDIWISR